MITAIITNQKLRLYKNSGRLNSELVSIFDIEDDQVFDSSIDQLKAISAKKLDQEKIILITPCNSNIYDEFIQTWIDRVNKTEKFRIYLRSPMHYPYLWTQLKEHDERLIVIEALEQESNVFYYIPEAVQHQRLTSVKGVGVTEGTHAVIENLISDLKDLGLSVKREELSEVWQSVFESRKETAGILKQGKYSKIKADFNIDDSLIRKAYHENNRYLKDYISDELLKKYDINNIYLLGDYFEKAQTVTFLKNLSNKVDLNIHEDYDEESVCQQMALGGLRMAWLKLDEERKRNLEWQRSQVHAREKLIERIKNEVINPEKRETYLETFRLASKETGVPFEMLEWYINNRLQAFQLSAELNELNAQLKEERVPLDISTLEHQDVEDLGSGESFQALKEGDLTIESQVTDDENETVIVPDEDEQNDFPLGTIHSEPDRPSEEYKIEKQLEAFEASDFSWPDKTEETLQLENIVQTERIYPNSEFILLKGKIKGSNIDRVFRIISSNELEEINNLQNFRRLYERESNYYNNVSKIFRSNFGLFYYRDFLEGDTLEEYIEKNNIDQKENLKDLSSDDLKLIFHLWKEVKELDFSFVDFHAGNILVTKVIKWNLNEEIGVKLVGIRSSVSTKKEMEDQLHNILDKLLYEGVYEAFKQKFM
jgi:hypothetical protein